MSPNGFAKLAVTTAGATIVAALIYSSSNTWSSGVATGEQMFPSLAKSAGDVSAIELKQGAQTLTLKRGEGDAWGVAERGGYSVKAEKVRKLMLELGEARLVEPRTRSPEKHAVLELEDPAGKDAKSRGLKLIGKNGKPIGEVILGKALPEAFGVGKGGMYVRKASAPQTWLADRSPDVPLGVKEWVDRSIVALEAAKQKQIVIEQPDGQAPLIVKQKLKDGKPDGFELGEPVPEGKKLKGGEGADTIARTFGVLDLEDVRKAVVAPAGAPVHKSMLETEDGMTLAYEIVKDKGEDWLTVKASGTADAVKTQVADINKRVTGWQFKLADFSAQQLTRTRADIYEDDKKDGDKK